MTKMSSVLSAFETLAQAPAGAPPQGGMPMMMIVGYVLLFAAMYFFMIAPQRKKQKAHEAMLKSLSPGDEIVTSGGIYGTITGVREDRFFVRVSEGTKIEIGKAFVQQVVSQKSGTEEKK